MYFDKSETDLEASKFKPVPVPETQDFSRPVYLTWKSEDRPAKMYNRFDQVPPEMREQVVAAWKLEKARQKAKEAAEKLAGSIRDLAQKELRDADNPAAFDKGVDDLAVASHFALMRDAIRIAKLKKQAPEFNMGQQNQPPYRTARHQSTPDGSSIPKGAWPSSSSTSETSRSGRWSWFRISPRTISISR